MFFQEDPPENDDWSKIQLDSQQQAVVNLREGIYVIRAGAGSGKTKCLTDRVLALIAEGEDPDSILAMTFTKEATKNMENRINNNMVHCMTIHRLCYLIMQDEMQRHMPDLYPFKLIFGTLQKIIFKKAIAKVSRKKDSGIDIGVARQLIGRAKNGMAKTTGEEVYDKVWRHYEAIKAKEKLVDFDDFCLIVIQMFTEYPELLEKYKGKYKWILIDEAQDTSLAQHKIANMIQSGNIFFICSLEQCIYEWRSAAPEIFANISQLYPSVIEVELNKNYRSDRAIITAANDIASKMQWQSLMMKPVRESLGSVIYAGHHLTIREEAKDVVDRVADETAILYRSNWQAMQIELELQRRGIKYHVVGYSSFFDFAEIKDMISYIILSITMKETDGLSYSPKEAFLRIFNRPNRYLGASWRDQAEAKIEYISIYELLTSQFVTKQRRDYSLWGKSQKELLLCLQMVQKMASPYDVVRFVREHMGYNDWLRKDKMGDGIQNEEDIMENLDQFEELCRELTREQLIAQAKAGSVMDVAGVPLSTVHRAKGLEWQRVLFPGLSDGLLPHIKSDNMQEELRIFYVGVTRARSKLVMMSARHKNLVRPSPYLKYVVDMSNYEEA